METKEASFVEKRALQFAIVYLTRRPDLRAVEPPSECGFELLIRISNSEEHNKTFGVVIEGELSRQNAPASFRRIAPSYQGSTLQIADMPIYIFLFLVDTDEGFYRLLEAPGISAAVQIDASEVAKQGFKRLDSQAIDVIVREVSEWYDRLSQAS